MSATSSLRPLLVVAVPVLAAVAIGLSRSRPTIREAWTILAAVTQAVLVASMLPAVVAGTTFVTRLGTLVPGVEFALRADGLGVLFALVASTLWLLTSVYNVGYTRARDEHAQTRYFGSFAATLGAAAGVAFAANLLVLFVFYELLTLATYPLVTHKETEQARIAGRKYVAYTFGGGVLVFVGIVLVFWLTGTTSFTPGGIAALTTADPTLARAAFAVLVAGFGVKAALMPLHSWLPEAMVAPTPVSGLLHAVAVVKSGVFGVARVVLDVYGVETMHALELGLPLAVVAAVTTLVASVFALKQRNLKRLLAYSTVSQLSYVVLGLAVLHPTAVAGGLFHIPAHAVMKLALFLCAGTVYTELHLEDIDEMAGVGHRMPVTMTVFAVAAAGMIGVPFTAGFVSKFALVVGSFDAGLALFAGVLAVNGVLKIVYFWPIVYQAFFETPERSDPKPVLDGPLGGYWGRWARASRPVPDGGGGGTATGDGEGGGTATGDGEGRGRAIEADDGHGHGTGDTGAAGGSWQHETSWLHLAPLVVLAVLTIVLGVAPDLVGVGSLVDRIVGLTTGGVV